MRAIAIGLCITLLGCGLEVAEWPVPEQGFAGYDANGVSRVQIAVLVRPGTPEALLARMARTHGATFSRFFPQIGLAQFTVPPGSADRVAEALSREEAIEQVEPVRRLVTERLRPGNQTGFQGARFELAWRHTQGEGSTVAVLDSGIDPKHPNLSGHIVRQATLVGRSILDQDGHGTHVAGVVAFAAPKAKLMPVKVLSQEDGSLFHLAEGLIWAADQGVSVINISLGVPQPSTTLSRAVRYALQKGSVVVASAGNQGQNLNFHSPSMEPGVIRVGASDERDQRADFSNWGPSLSVLAPGTGILSTWPTYAGTGNGTRVMDGTSQAAAFVSGLAALVRSRHPRFSPAQVKAAIERAAIDVGQPGFDPDSGYGRIDALNAL